MVQETRFKIDDVTTLQSCGLTLRGDDYSIFGGPRPDSNSRVHVVSARITFLRVAANRRDDPADGIPGNSGFCINIRDFLRASRRVITVPIINRFVGLGKLGGWIFFVFQPVTWFYKEAVTRGGVGCLLGWCLSGGPGRKAGTVLHFTPDGICKEQNPHGTKHVEPSAIDASGMITASPTGVM